MGNELYHHGIKGQRWGVRRYQNEDGSLTDAGRKRYDDVSMYNGRRSIKSGTAKKIAKGLAVAGTAALAGYALANPIIRQKIVNKVISTMPKAKQFAAEHGKKALKNLGESASKAGKAMSDAALMSIGTIGISTLTRKLEPNENASEFTKNRNKVLLDATTEGIKAITNNNKNNNNKNNKNSNDNNNRNVGSEITNIIGAPSNRGLDKTSSDYQNLFKDSNGNQRSGDVRSTIKSLASAGYDIDQLRRYVDSLDHGAMLVSPIDIGRLYISKIII